MDGLKIARDARVVLAGREIGRVSHVIVDPRTKEVTEVVVAHDGRESAVPIGEVVGVEGGTVRLREGASTALRGDFARDAFHGVDDRTTDAETAQTATHGGAPLREAAPDAVIIEQAAATTARVAGGAQATEGALRVPVAEERLTVGTREVELGAVEIRKIVTEEQRTVPVTLMHEEVHIEERDVAGRPATGENLFEEGTIRVALRGEEAVVAKDVVVTGEVVIDKERVLEEGHLTNTVRKEHVEVEEKTVRGTAASAQARATRKRNSPRR